MRYIVKRAAQTLISLYILATLTFALMQFFPGSPYDEEISLHPDVRAQIEETYGLSKNFFSQYVQFLAKLVSGDFGSSQFFSEKKVSRIISDFFPMTFILSFLSLVFSLTVSFSLALLSVKSTTHFKFVNLITLSLLSTPVLLFGPLSILIFGFYLDWFPVALLEKPLAYVLPVLTLSIKPIASLTRLLSYSVREQMKSQYVQIHRSFGFSEKCIFLKFVLKNSLIPFLSYLAPTSALLLAGSTIIEIMFSIQGMGSQFIEATLNRDVSVVVGLTLFYGFFIFFTQFIVDLIIYYLDRRVKLT